MSKISASYTSIFEEPGLLRRPVSPDEWQLLRKNFYNHAESLENKEKELAKAAVLSIAENLKELDGFMDILCRATCSSCIDICCHAKGVFYNEVDLFFLTVHGSFYPPSQTRVTASQKLCAYWDSDKGCRLPRLFRPYVCTWFICEAQSSLMEEILTPRNRRKIDFLYSTIRRDRLTLASLLRNAPIC